MLSHKLMNTKIHELSYKLIEVTTSLDVCV